MRIIWAELTLAETASACAETLVRQARLARPGGREALIATPDEWLQTACWYVRENMQAFRFEPWILEEGGRHDVAVVDLNTLFLRAHTEVYGNSVDLSTVDAHGWIAKGTVFRPTVAFYTLPCTCGLLFSLGL